MNEGRLFAVDALGTIVTARESYVDRFRRQRKEESIRELRTVISRDDNVMTEHEKLTAKDHVDTLAVLLHVEA